MIKHTYLIDVIKCITKIIFHPYSRTEKCQFNYKRYYNAVFENKSQDHTLVWKDRLLTRVF